MQHTQLTETPFARLHPRHAACFTRWNMLDAVQATLVLATLLSVLAGGRGSYTLSCIHLLPASTTARPMMPDAALS
jgi:hypothetical protein